MPMEDCLVLICQMHVDAKKVRSVTAEGKLTCEQEDCTKSALEGQNFSIYGEAGTRKSRVVSEICKRKGSNMRVVCSTGITCEVLKGDKNLSFHPAMLHSFLGVGTAYGSFNFVVKKACNNNVVLDYEQPLFFRSPSSVKQKKKERAKIGTRRAEVKREKMRDYPLSHSF